MSITNDPLNAQALEDRLRNPVALRKRSVGHPRLTKLSSELQIREAGRFQVIEEDPITIPNNQHLANELLQFSKIDELRESEFYRAYKSELMGLINEPRIYRASNPKPRLRSFLRVVEWNIERGTRLEGIVDVLNSHPVLRYADLLLLNEVDCGMRRSGNVNVALELSRALSAHAIFGVEYLELTKGNEDEC
ncbi:MAG TPA: hypothetical protein VN743_11565, partial [Blastocatellia bacterium]|nr:hypothetical protein [Blastocatellia bacterium]